MSNPEMATKIAAFARAEADKIASKPQGARGLCVIEAGMMRVAMFTLHVATGTELPACADFGAASPEDFSGASNPTNQASASLESSETKPTLGLAAADIAAKPHIHGEPIVKKPGQIDRAESQSPQRELKPLLSALSAPLREESHS